MVVVTHSTFGCFGLVQVELRIAQARKQEVKPHKKVFTVPGASSYDGFCSLLRRNDGHEALRYRIPLTRSKSVALTAAFGCFVALVLQLIHLQFVHMDFQRFPMLEIPKLPPALLAVTGGSPWLAWHSSCIRRIGHQMSI